jgi:hypothetical protein
MSKKKWHLMLAAEVMLAGGTVGEATAQQSVPVVREATTPSGCVSCGRPLFSLWKGRHAAEVDAVPLGQSLYQTMTNQIDSGIAARMILNDFDFEPNGVNLNFRGQDKLPRLVALAMQYPYFITIERTNYDPPLAALRRQALVKEIVRLSIPLSADRVVVGAPLTPGLRGVEAELLYQSLLNQTMSGGANLQGGGFGPAGPTTGGTQGIGQPITR